MSQFNQVCRTIDDLLKAKRMRAQGSAADVIEYKGNLLDTDKLIEMLLKICLDKVEKLDGTC